MPGIGLRKETSASNHGGRGPHSKTTPTRSDGALGDAPSLKGKSRVDRSGNRVKSAPIADCTSSAEPASGANP